MEQDWLGNAWRILVVRGLIAFVLGIVIIFAPHTAVFTFAVFWGIWALLEGLSSLGQAFQPGPGSVRLALGLLGVLALVVAVFALFHPIVTAQALTWILGIWLIVRGAIELVLTFTRTPPLPRGVLALGGGLDLLLGVLFAANPGKSALGLIALAWGAAFVVLGLLARSAGKQMGPPTAPAV
jgi:uncharacterized membrane protein HdeD (DUF308 family)